MEENLAGELTAFARRLAARRNAILVSWRRRVQEDPALAHASHLSLAQFYDHVPTLLDQLERELCATDHAEQERAVEEEKRSSAEHGVVRWQQGYNLVEVMHEWRHLHLCLVDELNLDCTANPAMLLAAQAKARDIVARFFADGICESSQQYTELRQTEAAGRAQYLEAAISRLYDGERERANGWREAAHDLRGKLGIVKNAADLIGRTELAEEDRAKSLRMLTDGVDWMRSFLNELMTLSRLEAGHERRTIARLDAAQLLKDLCNAMRHIAVERRLFLTVEGAAQLWVDGDEVKIRRIAQNLLQNALRYTEAGGVKVTWDLDTTVDTDRWTFCVQDTGPGLNHGTVTPIADALKDATDLDNETVDEQLKGQVPYTPPAPTLRSQSPQQSSDGPSGEGVGLAIVKRLCDLLDATLELQTAPGKGTTFRVTFPQRYERAE